LRRVALIKVAQRTGIRWQRFAKRWKTLPGERTPTSDDWKKLSAAWRGILNDRIDRLTRLRDQLDGCIGCGCLSLGVCPLRNPWDRLAKQGPGPRLLDPRIVMPAELFQVRFRRDEFGDRIGAAPQPIEIRYNEKLHVHQRCSSLPLLRDAAANQGRAPAVVRIRRTGDSHGTAGAGRQNVINGEVAVCIKSDTGQV